MLREVLRRKAQGVGWSGSLMELLWILRLVNSPVCDLFYRWSAGIRMRHMPFHLHRKIHEAESRWRP